MADGCGHILRGIVNLMNKHLCGNKEYGEVHIEFRITLLSLPWGSVFPFPLMKSVM